MLRFLFGKKQQASSAKGGPAKLTPKVQAIDDFHTALVSCDFTNCEFFAVGCLRIS